MVSLMGHMTFQVIFLKLSSLGGIAYGSERKKSSKKGHQFDPT